MYNNVGKEVVGAEEEKEQIKQYNRFDRFMER